MNLFTVLALILTLNTSIHVHGSQNICDNVASITAFARISEPIHGVITGYTPLLVLKLNNGLTLTKAALEAKAVVIETRQQLLMTTHAISENQLVVQVLSVVPLRFHVLYTIRIKEANNTCILKVEVMPPSSTLKYAKTKQGVFVTSTIRENPQGMYDPLGFLDANVTFTKKDYNILPSQYQRHKTNGEERNDRTNTSKALFLMAIGFLGAALIITVIDYLSSRRDNLQHASGA